MKKVILAFHSVVLLAAAISACDGGVCSDAETASCSTDHSSCVSGCGTGVEPNYEACVVSCDEAQCTCLDACGSTCK